MLRGRITACAALIVTAPAVLDGSVASDPPTNEWPFGPLLVEPPSVYKVFIA